jgi:peptide-methionine (S)-S-oxide reductase
VVTQIVMLDDFYPAEAEHQNYHQNNPVRYNYYRTSCGRDARLKQLWGDPAGAQ